MTERDEQQQALDAALTALEKGASLDSVLAADPARAAELRPLLLAAVAAGSGAELARVAVGGQVASRAQFLAAAANFRATEGGGAMAPAALAGGDWWSRLRAGLGRRSMAGGSLLARAVAVGLVVLGGLGAGGYGVVAASNQSLPGDPLYGVKRTVESTELLLAADPQTRARLQSEFDDRRVHEAQAVSDQGRHVPVEFTGTLISMNGAQSQHWLVSGIAVLVGPQALVVGDPLVGARVHIQGTVEAVGEVQAQQVTVLPLQDGPADAPATPSMTAPVTASPTATPTFTSVGETANAAPTQAAPEATEASSATATNANPLAPTVTLAPTATDDYGGGPGPSPSHTPEATHDGGGDHDGTTTRTPEPTENDDHEGTAFPTPKPTSGGGASPSSTPKPTEIGDDHGDASYSNTPRPTSGNRSGGGPPSSNTPKPND